MQIHADKIKLQSEATQLNFVSDLRRYAIQQVDQKQVKQCDE